MRTLTVANMYPSEADPVYGTFVKIFYDGLCHHNHCGTNDLVTIRGKRRGVLSKIKAYIGFYASLFRTLCLKNYDLIYVHTVTFPILPIKLVGCFKKLPLVFNVHGGDVIPSNGLKAWLKERAKPQLRKAAMIVCPTDYFKAVVLEEFPGVSAENLFVSPSGGLPGHFYLAAPKERREIPVIGYVSRIDQGKGWDIYLKALSIVKKAGVQFKGVMVGRGAQVDSMIAMRDSLGLQGSVDYLGPKPQSELPEIYRSFDLFVFPTIRKAESLGLVGLEAMAAGTPVVASNMAGPAEYVRHGENGYLFAPGDADELAEMILAYTRNATSRRDVMSENARATASDYRADIVARNLYEKLLTLPILDGVR